MTNFSQIREHMEVIGADGVHVGAVDKVEGDRIKLTKKTVVGRAAAIRAMIISSRRVLSPAIEGDQVRLSANADVAVTFEEEEAGN